MNTPAGFEVIREGLLDGGQLHSQAADPGLAVFYDRLKEAPDFPDPDHGPDRVHHEFVSGMHGRKIDFDAIPDGSDLFEEWVGVNARMIRRLYSGEWLGTRVLLGVANGTNRLVQPVADLLDDGTVALQTEKTSPRSVSLTGEAAGFFKANTPDFVLALEDAATRGTTSAAAVVAARQAGAVRVEVLNTWQRRERLEELLGIGVAYNSIIHENLPTLTPEECKKSGYCALGWKLIEHA